MTQSTNAPVDSTPSNSENGEVRSNSHALMVREYEMNALSPYMAAGPGAMYVDGTPSGLSFSQLAHALRRRWLVALIAGLAVGLPIAVLAWLLTPDTYEVTALLRVGDKQELLMERNLFRNQAEYDAYRKTLGARIRSQLVLVEALHKEGISELPMLRAESEPRKFLEDELIVLTPPEQELLQIKMRGKDPQQLVKIVNAVKDSFMENVVNAENNETLYRHDLLERTLKEKNDEILRKRTNLEELKRRTNSSDLEDVKFRYAMAVTKMNSMVEQIRIAKSELAMVETKLEMVENQKRIQPRRQSIWWN